MDAFMFDHPKLVQKQLTEADFLTIATLVLSKHNLIVGRDWSVLDHAISVEADITKEEEVLIAEEIEDIVSGVD